MLASPLPALPLLLETLLPRASVQDFYEAVSACVPPTWLLKLLGLWAPQTFCFTYQTGHNGPKSSNAPHHRALLASSFYIITTVAKRSEQASEQTPETINALKIAFLGNRGLLKLLLTTQWKVETITFPDMAQWCAIRGSNVCFQKPSPTPRQVWEPPYFFLLTEAGDLDPNG